MGALKAGRVIPLAHPLSTGKAWWKRPEGRRRDVQTKQLDRLTNEGAMTWCLARPRPGETRAPDKPFFPGARFCHVLQEHLRSPRFPGARGEERVSETFALQAKASEACLPQAPPHPLLPPCGGQILQLSATLSPGDPSANVHGDGLCKPKI